MSAQIAVDILAGAFRLSPAQERVLRECQGYVRHGHAVNAATRRVLTRLGLIEKAEGAPGFFVTAWGDAIGEELVAREAAKDEHLPEIWWHDSKGWLAEDRFQIVIHAPGVYGLDDTQGRAGSTFKTLVHAQQLVREILAEEYREAYEARLQQELALINEKGVSAYANLFEVTELLTIDSVDAQPGDLITMIGDEVLDEPFLLVAEAAQHIYGPEQGPIGVRLDIGSRSTVTYLYVDQHPKISIRRPAS